MMQNEKVPPRLMELSQKVETLAEDLVDARKENARLKRMLSAAESRIRQLSDGGVQTQGVTLPQLNSQLEKMKNERKIIKAKVEQMASRLAKFYGE